MTFNTSKTILYLAAILLFWLVTPNNVQCAPGDLDPAFGNRGTVGILANTIPRVVRVQGDGKIITLGSYAYASITYISRSNANGTPDTSFGTNGLVLITEEEVDEHFLDFITLPDGKYLVTGYKENRCQLFRYNSNGTRDTSLGTGGVLTSSLCGESIVLQPDGKVILGGYNEIDGVYRHFLVRYNSDGTLDAGFGENGIVFPSQFYGKIVLQPDGKILVRASDSQIARYNANGSRDNTFRFTGTIGTGISNVTGIGFQSNGKIIIGGTISQTLSRIERYNDNGTLDTTFGANGRVDITDTSNNQYSLGIVRSLAVQRDNKIVTAGSVNGIFAVYRLDSNGGLDATFGATGLVTTSMSSICRFFDITLQSDGKIVAVGDTGSPNGTQYVGLVRYLGDNVVQVTNIEELYAAVNDPVNAGMQIVISPGVYMLSVNDAGGVARPNRGRLELQQNMSLQGVVGDRGAVTIDAINLPLTSFNNAAPIPLTAAIRMGRGTNSLEWLTVRNAVNGNANIGTELASTTTSIRVAHVASTNSQRGIDVRNFGTAQAGRVIEAEIVDNDLYNNRIGTLGEGLRIVNNNGANGGRISARLSGNRSYNNYLGIIVENNRSNNANISVVSSGDRFYENGLGGLVGAGLSAASTPSNGNTVDFTANGCRFENNNGFNNFDHGGLIFIGGENTSIPNGTSSNTVNAVLRGCRLGNNQLYDLAAFGARSYPVSIGLPGTNNRVSVRLYGTHVPVLNTDDSIPDSPDGMNSATVINVPPIRLSGRVVTPDGIGLRNAAVSLIDSQGVSAAATTSSFGLFVFDTVRPGETYTISVGSKRFRFAPRSVLVENDVTVADFVGLQ